MQGNICLICKSRDECAGMFIPGACVGTFELTDKLILTQEPGRKYRINLQYYNRKKTISHAAAVILRRQVRYLSKTRDQHELRIAQLNIILKKPVRKT